MKEIKNIFLFLINTNIFVALCVCALSISSEYLFNSHNLRITQFVFLSTLFTYNYQRVVRIKKGVKHKRKEWTLNNNSLVYFLIGIGIIGSFYHFFQMETISQIFILLFGMISLLYPFGIRRIPFFKIFIISLTWTISTMLLVVLENNIPLNINTYLHLICRFLFVFAICIPFDIRDIKYDNIKLKTIPISVGISKSKLISVFSLFSIGLISIYQFQNYNLKIEFLISIILSCIVSSIFINKSDEKKSDFFFSFWIESLSILFYLFLTISILIF